MKRLLFISALIMISLVASAQNRDLSHLYRPYPISGFDNQKFDIHLNISEEDEITEFLFVKWQKPAYAFYVETKYVFKVEDGMGLGFGAIVIFMPLTPLDVFTFAEYQKTSDKEYYIHSAIPVGVYFLTMTPEGESLNIYKARDNVEFFKHMTSWDSSKQDQDIGEHQENVAKSTNKATIDEKYISVSFLENFKGLYPKQVEMNKVVYPNGDTVYGRDGLLFFNDDSNFMITLGVIPKLYATYTFKSHPDLGNIISMQVLFETDVASITTKNSKVIDYKVIGKLKPGTYAIPLDNRGHNKGFFRVNLPNNQLEYWYFQREDCTLSPNIIKESSTQFDFK